MRTPAIVDFRPFQSDDDARLVVGFHNAAMAEVFPRRLPISVEQFRARFDAPSTELHTFGVLEDTSSLAALGVAMQWVDGTNAHLQFIQILVRPDRRRNGLGKAILAHGVSIAERTGRTMVTADAVDTVPAGDIFAKRLGAELGIREHINVVAVADLDTAMLERWRAEGQGRAPGYELLQWEDWYPDNYHGSIARLFFMADEDMPFEDAAFEPQAQSAEAVRERLERTKGTRERVVAAVRHIATDEIVGFSELLSTNPDDPTLQTTLTAVNRDHRGHAIGKWIKADAILRGLARYPRTTHIQTENAFSNAPMLGINDLIGFRPEHTLLAYQATTAAIRKYLDAASE